MELKGGKEANSTGDHEDVTQLFEKKSQRVVRDPTQNSVANCTIWNEP